ncbi:MAG: hypothetical protein E7300_08875 [Lachnospiraceae bacterium]|nr:hypothetical protein [Lachnospiraceae bacterium]
MKILFIGNSHTYMNDMPKLAGEMIENVTGEFCEVFMLAYSARSLKWHMGRSTFPSASISFTADIADFDKAYDFTLPGGDWLPVKEDIADELVRIPSEVVHVIRECVDKAVLDE